MIMPCMNWTFARECGGNVALVEDGSVRVGWPGAPGWTTTGDAGLACCAETDSDNKQASAPAKSSPRHTTTLITDGALSAALKWWHFIDIK